MNQIKEKSMSMGKKGWLYEFLFQARCPNCGKRLPYSILPSIFDKNTLFLSNMLDNLQF